MPHGPDPTLRLSSHFTLGELATTNVRSLQDENLLDAWGHLLPLQALCLTLLQPLRDHLGSPVVVVSGYRNPALNELVGGAQRSQHLAGEAADLHLPGHDLREVWTWLGWESGLPFGQLVLEGQQAGRPTWIHLSLGVPFRSPERCGEILTWSRAGGYKLAGRAPWAVGER